MGQTSITKDELKALIREAFKDVRLGDGVGLFEGRALDDYAPEEEQKRAREKDEKMDWSAISADDLWRCESSLSFFDAEGMRFHLPAFMIADIDELSNCGPTLALTSHLSGHSFGLLNAEQREAVVKYLEWCLESDWVESRKFAEEALEAFWRC